MDVARRVRLGNTAVTVTQLGLGTASMGGWPEEQNEADAVAAIQVAWDTGVRYFDTAPLYGYSQAEVWLSRALAGYPRDEYAWLSKAGKILRPLAPGEPDPNRFYKTLETSLRPHDDYTVDGIRRSVIESLERTGLDYYDIVLIHDPQDRIDQVDNRQEEVQ